MAEYGDPRSRVTRLAAMTAMHRGRGHGLAAGSGGDATGGRIRLQQRLWTAVAVALLVGGSAGTVVAASIQSHHNGSQANQAFRSLTMLVDTSELC